MKRFLVAAAVLVIAGVTQAVPAMAAQQQKPPPVHTVTVGSNPIDVVISQRQSKAYVANDGSVSVLSLVTHREVAQVGTGFHDQTAIGLVRCDSEAYIGTFNLKDLKVLNTSTLKLSGTIDVGFGATDIVAARTPSGEYAYVTLLTSNAVAVVRTSDNKLVKTIRLPAGPQTAQTTPDGKDVWVGSSYSGHIWVVSTATQRVVRDIPVPDSGPVSSIAFAPGGKRAWVYGLAGVSVIDVTTGDLLAFLPITYLYPHSPAPNAGPIALTAGGAYALVVNSTFPDDPMRGTVAVVDTRTLHVLDRVTVGTEPTGLAIDYDRQTAYVTNFQDDTVSYFKTPCDH